MMNSLPSTSRWAVQQQPRPPTYQIPYYKRKLKPKEPLSYKYLEGCSSTAVNKTTFNKRWTYLIPDQFLIITFAVVTLASAASSHFLTAATLLKGHKLYGIIFLAIFLISQSFIAVFDSVRNNYRRKKKFEDVSIIKPNSFGIFIYKICIILGIDCLLIVCKLLYNVFQLPNISNYNATDGSPVRLFQLSDAQISTIKIHSLLTATIRSIPQTHTSMFLLMTKELDQLTVTAIWLTILTNCMIFSFAMTISLPLKKSSTIFQNASFIPIISFSKFMSVMSFTAANIIYFKELFQNLKYFSLLVYFFKFACMYAFIIENASRFWVPYMKKHIVFYGLGLSIIYLIMYIHPVKGRGQLSYYAYYCFKFIIEIAVIYLCSAETDSFLMDYMILFVVGIGFLSSAFGFSILLEV